MVGLGVNGRSATGGGAGVAPLCPLLNLLDGSACSELNFTLVYENLESFIRVLVYGDRGEELEKRNR